MTYENPQRIRIVEKGWETFTDEMCGVRFVNGVSVDPVPPMQARIIANVVRTEAEDGSNPSITQALIDSNDVPMGDIDSPEAPVASKKEAEVKNAETKQEEKQPAQLDAFTRHTKEELEEIADKQGIKGLRAIAEPLGVKGRGIEEIIQEILVAEAKAAKTA